MLFSVSVVGAEWRLSWLQRLQQEQATWEQERTQLEAELISQQDKVLQAPHCHIRNFLLHFLFYPSLSSSAVSSAQAGGGA